VINRVFGLFALTAIALAGCSARATGPGLSCALEVTQICVAGAETQFTSGVRMADDSEWLLVGHSTKEAQVVPYVVPVLQPDGTLATEVDCFANTDFRSFSIVRAQVAIPPESTSSVAYLRARHLCADEETGTVARL
jgi:uncharacterized lipoprotein YbaY